jgi:hypothetical protein
MDTLDALFEKLPIALARHRETSLCWEWRDVIQALGQVQDVRSAKALASALADAYSPEILSLNEPISINLTSGETQGRDVAYEEAWELRKALKHLGNVAVEPILELLESERPRVRAAACRLLRDIPDARSIAPLIRLLGDQAWADIGDSVNAWTVPALERVNECAAQALAAIGPPARDALMAAAESPNEMTKRLALEVLAKFSPEARSALEALKKTTGKVRRLPP